VGGWTDGWTDRQMDGWMDINDYVLYIYLTHNHPHMCIYICVWCVCVCVCIAPNLAIVLKFCPITSVDYETSFSKLYLPGVITKFLRKMKTIMCHPARFIKTCKMKAEDNPEQGH